MDSIQIYKRLPRTHQIHQGFSDLMGKSPRNHLQFPPPAFHGHRGPQHKVSAKPCLGLADIIRQAMWLQNLPAVP